jgi:hypothetical protein
MRKMTMRQISSKKITNRQSSFFFLGTTHNNNQNITLDNIVYFDKNQIKELSSKQDEKREKIIDKLLEHAKNLKW